MRESEKRFMKKPKAKMAAVVITWAAADHVMGPPPSSLAFFSLLTPFFKAVLTHLALLLLQQDHVFTLGSRILFPLSKGPHGQQGQTVTAFDPEQIRTCSSGESCAPPPRAGLGGVGGKVRRREDDH